MRTIWLDAHLSPRLAHWLAATFEVQAVAVRDLGLRQAEDHDIFFAARKVGAIVVTKDNDFLDLLERHGSPPKIIWLRFGNSSNLKIAHKLVLHQDAIRAFNEDKTSQVNFLEIE